MNEPKPPKSTLDLLERLSASNILTLYHGAWSRLRDLQELQATGRRIPGGLSGRIHLAHLNWIAINDALKQLAEHDPDKARAVQEDLAISSIDVMRDKAKAMQRILAGSDQASATGG